MDWCRAMVLFRCFYSFSFYLFDFLKELILLYFYCSWLVNICLEKLRCEEDRAEWWMLGMLHACCRSKWPTINRAPWCTSVPQVIPAHQHSERQTGWCWPGFHWLNYILFLFLLLPFDSIIFFPFLVEFSLCSLWLVQEYTHNHILMHVDRFFV